MTTNDTVHLERLLQRIAVHKEHEHDRMASGRCIANLAELAEEIARERGPWNLERAMKVAEELLTDDGLQGIGSITISRDNVYYSLRVWPGNYPIIHNNADLDEFYRQVANEA
jgi:hypothetical protein